MRALVRDPRASDLPADVERVVYLGGLGPTGPDASAHLRSRHEVAQLLAQRVSTV